MQAQAITGENFCRTEQLWNKRKRENRPPGESPGYLVADPDDKIMDIINQKILITGASGLVGRQLIHYLTGTGVRPIAHCRETSDANYIDAHRLEKRIADLRNVGELKRLVEGIDGIIHTAALVNFRRDRRTEFAAVNVMGAVDLYKAARAAGVMRFVHLSTVAAVGALPRTGDGNYRSRSKRLNEDAEFNLEDLNIPYIQTKHAAERALLELTNEGGPELVIVNPSIIVSPSRTGDDRSTALKAFNGMVMPDFCNVVNLVDVRDVAPGVVAALQHGRPGNRYILAGDNIIIRDLMLAVSEILGKTPHLLAVPRWLLSGAARFRVGVDWFLGRGRVSIYPDLVRLADFDWSFSSLKARTELGYRNRPIYETLDDLLNNKFIGSWRTEPAR